jgi:hypothetical protein
VRGLTLVATRIASNSTPTSTALSTRSAAPAASARVRSDAFGAAV